MFASFSRITCSLSSELFNSHVTLIYVICVIVLLPMLNSNFRTTFSPGIGETAQWIRDLLLLQRSQFGSQHRSDSSQLLIIPVEGDLKSLSSLQGH